MTRRRRIAVVLCVLLGFLALFYGAGGWYFAEQIRSDALAVADDPTPDGPVPDGAEEITYGCGGDAGPAVCPAWYVPGEADTWAILVHGRAASRAEPLHGLAAAERAGMPALDIAYRNDPGAPADPSGFYRYGATEWADLAGAVDHARSKGARRVVLFGFSMGGAIVASYLRHTPDSSRGFVFGVVLDSPMLDLGRTIDYEASQRSLPLLGLPIPSSLVGVAKAIAGKRFGVDWDDLDYVGSDWLNVPALVFHGDDDGTVPVSTSRAFAAAADDVTLVVTPGATHVASREVDPAAYDRSLDEFLAGLT